MAGFNEKLVRDIRARFPDNKNIQNADDATLRLAHTAMNVCFPRLSNGSLNWALLPVLLTEEARAEAWNNLKKIS